MRCSDAQGSSTPGLEGGPAPGGDAPCPPQQHRAPGSCCFFLLGTTSAVAPSLWLPGISKCHGSPWWFGESFFKHIRDFSGFWPLSVPNGQRARPSWSSSGVGTSTAASAMPRGLKFHQIHKNARTSHHSRRILHQKPPSAMAPHPPLCSPPSQRPRSRANSPSCQGTRSPAANNQELIEGG